MRVAFDMIGELEAALRGAAEAAGVAAGGFEPGVRTSDPRHGDFQANGVLGAAKRAGLPPRPLAEAIVARLGPQVREYFEVSVAGPGFVNFAALPALLFAWLRAHASADDLAKGASAAHAGETWVVDYSSPNSAKQMHVGHLRSAVIGEAISRLIAFTGARVVRDNHVGDWGTQYGKLIWAYRGHLDRASLERDAVEEFERLYKLGNAAAESDPAVMEEARRELVRLQAGDPESTAIWKELLQRQGRGRLRGALLERGLIGEPGGAGRLPSRAPEVQGAAAHRAQVRRRRQLRDHGPGHDPVPHGALPRRGDPVRG
jgi:arginyl-tRNA synthetase